MKLAHIKKTLETFIYSLHFDNFPNFTLKYQ